MDTEPIWHRSFNRDTAQNRHKAPSVRKLNRRKAQLTQKLAQCNILVLELLFGERIQDCPALVMVSYLRRSPVIVTCRIA